LSQFKSDQWIPPAPRAKSPRTPVAGPPPFVRARAQPPPPFKPKLVYQDQTPATLLGFPIALVYVLALFSLSTELGMILLGVKPYITWITGPIGMMAAFASGNLLRSLKPGPGRWLILFTVWMILAIPFSIFRGGSLAVMQDYTLKQLPVLLMLVALTTSLGQVEWFCRTMAFTGVLLLLICLKFGGYADNRFMIPNTSLENPNDFATHLLIALPFCLLMILNSSRFSVLKVIGIVGVGGLTLAILRSGSRGGLIALLAVIALLFWHLPGIQRVSLLAVCVVCAGLATAIFPQVLWDRFKTILSTEAPAQTSTDSTSTDSRTVEFAESSTNSRWYLLKRSLVFSAKNPILGLGPGNFVVAETGLAKQEGRRGAWLGTHNSYTQASSEGGIPAFLFFTAALVSSIGINARIYKRTWRHRELKPIANTALCLMLALSGFAVDILFSHLAFRYYLPMLAGITMAFSAVAEREIQAALAPSRNGIGTKYPGNLRFARFRRS
jgi:hypothetical protein